MEKERERGKNFSARRFATETNWRWGGWSLKKGWGGRGKVWLFFSKKGGARGGEIRPIRGRWFDAAHKSRVGWAVCRLPYKELNRDQ